VNLQADQPVQECGRERAIFRILLGEGDAVPQAKKALWNLESVPTSALRLYRLVWQLENWLRAIVYVELRANRVDWEEPIKKAANNNWPPRPQAQDKALHHMATRHQVALSFLTFPELWKIVESNDYWDLFEEYFPPKTNVAPRIDEVKTIRNRVAHFREPHENDEARLKLFLQDMEPGLKRFCARYTDPARLPADNVTTALEADWEAIGYGIELWKPNREWLYAEGPHRMAPLLNVDLEVLTHEKQDPSSRQGVIYKLSVGSGMQKDLDAVDFLECTSGLHGDVIHIFMVSAHSVIVTIPAILGDNKVVDLIKGFLKVGLNRSGNLSDFDPSSKQNWPEYVLWPDHSLGFFSGTGEVFEMP
jgi:hypothetical protein